MSDYTVRGRSFRTPSDYQAALRDERKIQAVLKKYETVDLAGKEHIMGVLNNGDLKFETLIGEDFIDEMEERHQQVLKEEKSNTGKKGKKKKPASKKVDKSKIKEKKKKVQQEKKQLEDYDAVMQMKIKQEIYLQEKKRKRTVMICSLVAVFCIGYVIFYYYLYERNSSEYEHLASLKEETIEEDTEVHINYTKEEKKELVLLEKYKKLYSQNKSLIGWLKIDDTNIDYPVMQTTDNEYYQNHNLNQEYDKNGSIFMDKDCDVKKPSTNYILYGHHMKSGRMFGTLDKYESEKYYKEHKYIQFDTIYEKGLYQVMYVFRSRVYNEDDVVFKYYRFIDANSEQEFDSYMQEMAGISFYDTGVTAVYGDQLLTLSTCDYQEKDGRFVVVAKRIEAKE